MGEKTYLGDSVYATMDANPGHITLTTENGYGPSNTIHLNEDALMSLFDFIQSQTGAKINVVPAEHRNL